MIILKPYLIFILIITLFLEVNCQKKPQTVRSFYYWKTELNFSEDEKRLLSELKVEQLLVKYFDVEWNEASKSPIPVGVLKYRMNRQAPYTLPPIIPCIFITNETILKCSLPQLDTLAHQIQCKVDQLNSEYVSHYIEWRQSLKPQNLNRNKTQQTSWVSDSLNYRNEWLKTWSEVQIDCDWTQGSREKYFGLLRKIKECFGNRQISCTLRLWQYKYRTLAGIPPVKKCMLMCYSTGDPKNYKTQNSIATYSDLKSYLIEAKYPLLLDIALPIYNWAVIFRNRKFVKLISNFDEKQIRLQPNLYKKMAEHWFQIQLDTVLSEQYLRAGDEIRFEQVEMEELNKMTTLLTKRININDETKITLFSWDTLNLQQYEIKNINRIYHRFN